MTISIGGFGRTRAVACVLCVLAVGLLGAGCGTAPVDQRAAVPGVLHRLFPGFALRYGGTARLVPAAAPSSSALPGANDLLAAGGSVLAATATGIFRSTDGGVSWQQVLSGVSAWSLASVPAGGYAALATLPAAGGFGPPVLATSSDGLH